MKRVASPLAGLAILVCISVGLHASMGGLRDQEGQTVATAQSMTLSGTFTIVWGDNRDPSVRPVKLFRLTDDSGQTIALEFDAAVGEAAGGVLALNGKRVTVEVQAPAALLSADDRLRLRVLSMARADQALAAGYERAVSGTQKWVSLMCKYADIAASPHNLAFFQGMYANVTPGLDHYWRDQSYNVVDLTGSTAFGWYTMAHNRAYYIYDRNGNGTDTDPNDIDTTRLANDCTAVADPSVDFSTVVGINMFFNGDLADGWALGGTHPMTLDGVNKVWRMTWEPSWAAEDISVIAHETGHGFEFPHSSGLCVNCAGYPRYPYNNPWDVMSQDRWTCAGVFSDATYGCIPQGTIGYHKSDAGWLAAARLHTVSAGSSATITIDRLGAASASNYQVVNVPYTGGCPAGHTCFYTVEARKYVSYDAKIPGEAVIIHNVDPVLDEPARVVDDTPLDDNNGDAGSMWVVGETFTDPLNTISVTVNSATANGFNVTVSNNPALPPPPVTPPDPFTDDPLVPGVTPIKAVHVTQLRQHIAATRAAKSLAAYTWTNTLTAGTTPVRANDITEMRLALQDVYDALGLNRPTYSTSPAAGVTITATDITELRLVVVFAELMAGVRTCAASAALEGQESAAEDLFAFRGLRDRVLASSVFGQAVTTAYYRHSPEVIRQFLLRPRLAADVASLAHQLSPIARQLSAPESAGSPATPILTSELIDAIERVLDQLQVTASPALQNDLTRFRQVASLKSAVGLSAREYWNRLASVSVTLGGY